MNFQDDIKLALANFEESSKRCRSLTTMLALVSIVVLAITWQQENHAWFKSRLRTIRSTHRLLACLKCPEPGGPYGQELIPFKASDPKRNELVQQCQKQLAMSEAELDADIEQIREYPRSEEEEKAFLTELERALINHVLTINIPLLGITMDVNDLSVLSGLTLSIILGWYYLAIKRHELNLNKIYKLATEQECVRAVYDLIVMSQVLTNPPQRNALKYGPLVFSLPSAIMFVTFIAQLAIVVEDAITAQYGFTIAKDTTSVVIWSSRILLFVVFVACIACFLRIKDTYWAWVTFYIARRVETEKLREERELGRQKA